MLSAKKIVARGYQTELLTKALEQNVIIALGTGTGKTHIATMLLEEFSDLLMQSTRLSGKRAIFLVPSVPLVYQQAQYIERHTLFRAGRYCGKENVDSWNVRRWSQELDEHHVLVMVGQVFANAITKGLLEASKLCLLIVDECHHVRKNHPYRAALHNLAKKVREQKVNIRVVGLTASVINIVIDEKQFQHFLDEFDKIANATSPTANNNDSILNPIEKNIRELEENMLKAVVVQPKNLSLVDECGALPSIIFHEYKIHSVDDELLLAIGGSGRALLQNYDAVHLTPNQREIIRRLQSTIQYTQLFLMGNAPESRKSSRQGHLSEKLCEILQKNLRHLLSTYKELGVLALYKTTDGMLLAQLNKQWSVTTFASGKSIITYLQTELRLLCRMLCVAYDIDEFATMNVEQAKTLCSSAVVETLELLRRHELQSRMEKRPFSAIVFVRRRYSAWALHSVITDMCKIDKSPYSRLKSLFIVGRGGLKEARVADGTNGSRNIANFDLLHGAGSSDMTSGSGKPDDLRLFRTGTCNVLVSTAVTEEGLDVPQCNLIIRFSLPTDYRGFIQSKGRARAKNSKYYVMVPDAVRGLAEKRLNHYTNLYKEILRTCADRVKKVDADDIIDNAAADRKVFLTPPYKARAGGEINMYNSVSTLHQYCQSASGKAAAGLAAPVTSLPTFRFKELTVSDKRYNELFGEIGKSMADDIQRTAQYMPNGGGMSDGGMRTYACTLTMPTGEVFPGEWMPTRMTAKQTACQIACQKLHELGKLNDNLMPRSKTGSAAVALPTEAASRRVNLSNVGGLADRLASLRLINTPPNSPAAVLSTVPPLQQHASLQKKQLMDALVRK